MSKTLIDATAAKELLEPYKDNRELLTLIAVDYLDFLFGDTSKLSDEELVDAICKQIEISELTEFEVGIVVGQFEEIIYQRQHGQRKRR